MTLITRIPLKKIIIDNSIVNALKRKNSKFNIEKFSVDKGVEVGDLTRLDNVLDSIIKGVHLQPVKLSQVKIYVPPHKRIVKSINYRSMYYIIDGRHRIASNILLNRENIDAHVINY